MKQDLLLFALHFASILPPADPFLRRVYATIDDWIASEWERKEAIRTEALSSDGWTPERHARLRDATLTTHRLANRIDGMSEATFRRELAKLGAPPPGELIRKARMRHATKLLTHTRLMIHKIAKRCGYKSEKHFADAFRAEFHTTPSEYRRKFISGPPDT
ncbi:helix-turn-helix transcriptional regulator [Hyphomicrobium sp. DY-1]|uniref:helix-turn-helix transcriptional regulator n=1 Tax=Hyphomicrobium sp. DY-1 TaxID=3075650 RepID=UPI0039C09DBD